MDVLKEQLSIKQVNVEVKEMVQGTKRTLAELKSTKAKLINIKKAYDILLSDKYIQNIHEAFDHKIKLLQDVASKQNHFITLLRGNQTFLARDRLAARLEQVGRKVEELFEDDQLLSGLVRLELFLDRIEKKKSQLESKIENASSDYSFLKRTQ